LHFESEDYPGLRGLHRRLFFLATAFDLHRARHIRGAASYVAIAWFLIPAFYSKTLKRPVLSLYSSKTCPLVLPVENDLAWFQLDPPPTEEFSALMSYLHSGYSARHMFLHFVYPTGLGKYYTLFEPGAFVPYQVRERCLKFFLFPETVVKCRAPLFGKRVLNGPKTKRKF
jgi:hypothetical protein